MEDYLIHHGILGQRWGVRRFQNLDGSLTPAGKKHYSSKKQESFPTSDDVTIPKGSIRSHVSTRKKINLKDKKMYLYDPSIEKDRTAYEGSFLVKSKKDVYLHTYETKKDLTSPSEKNRVDNFLETYFTKPKKYSEELNLWRQAILSTYLDAADKSDSEKALAEINYGKAASYKKDFSKDTSLDDLKTYGYDLFTLEQQFTRNDQSGKKYNSLSKQYTKNLEKKGYNSLIDDSDRIHNFRAVSPLITLNAKKTLKEIGIEEINKETLQKNSDEFNSKYFLKGG